MARPYSVSFLGVTLLPSGLELTETSPGVVAGYRPNKTETENAHVACLNVTSLAISCAEMCALHFLLGLGSRGFRQRQVKELCVGAEA